MTAMEESAQMVPEIVVVTGNMASGKSTVAQALAEELPRSVHLRGDLFRRMIVNGRAPMGFDLSPDAEEQLRLRHGLAATVARRYVQAGFTVVYQDILIGNTLEHIVANLIPLRVAVVVLCPTADVIEAREAARSKKGYQNRRAIDAFDRVLRKETPPIGLWLDTSNLTVDETTATILERIDEARIPGSFGNNE